jgi:geranylgeranyl pyrophosphate synthase
MNDEQYFLDTYKKAAYEVVDEVKRHKESFIATFPTSDSFRQEILRFVTDGGKRFRPALSYLVAKYYGNDYLFPHTALETFHKYLLTHDDVIDRDRVRYSAPTVHAKLEELMQNKISEEEKSHYCWRSNGSIDL